MKLINAQNQITLTQAAEYTGINYNTIKGAARRFLKKDKKSNSKLKCKKADFGTIIFTTITDVDNWVKNKKRPGQYERIKGKEKRK